MSASPTPTSSFDASNLALPACADLIDLTTAREDFAEGSEFTGELLADEIPQGMPGPLARSTAASASPAHGCVYGIPYSDGAFTVSVLGLSSGSMASLRAGLESSFTPVAVGADTAYGHTYDGNGLYSSYGALYVVRGPAWIAVLGPGEPSTYRRIAQSALERLVAANPGL